MSERLRDLLRLLKSRGSRRNVEGMRRYGITAAKAFGVAAPDLRKIAKETGKDHRLALHLWSTRILDARVLAVLVDEPAKVTRRQMERWARDFDNWAICDTCCGNLFVKSPFACDAALEWSRRKEEFVKRAGFALMAWLAVHDKRTADGIFHRFLARIRRASTDDRIYVRKAVNWALRQIGKRSMKLNRIATAAARDIAALDSRSARWIGTDALRELRSEPVQKRLRARARKRMSVASRLAMGAMLLCMLHVCRAQAPEVEIRSVLDRQVEAWNAGDITGYMNGYWKSDSLLFTSGGRIESGWEATLKKYLAAYDTRTRMGFLTFGEVDVRVLSTTSAWVFGRWELERETDHPHGVFTLVMRKFPEGWRIVHDHTSSSD